MAGSHLVKIGESIVRARVAGMESGELVQHISDCDLVPDPEFRSPERVVQPYVPGTCKADPTFCLFHRRGLTGRQGIRERQENA